MSSTASSIYGGVGFLKARPALADRITTVSPTYAAEILHAARAAWGWTACCARRAGRLSRHPQRHRRHGLEPGHRPASRRALQRAARRPGGPRNKAALQAAASASTTSSDALLFGVVSRLTWQKGLDLLLDALPVLLGRGAQLALLGAGEAGFEAGFAAAAAAHPGRVGCVIGYDEALAHLIQAGADALLVPSRFEPCGLTQLCALALRRDAGGGARRRPGRHGDRRQRGGAGRRRRHRRAVRAARARVLGRR